MKISTLVLILVLWPLCGYALDCPNIPVQARKDLEIEVKTAVVKIGPARGAELEARTKTAIRDLMGKLPKADKVYLEQMMYATYCSALRDDKSLSESEKAARIRTYNFEVRKTLYRSQGKLQEGRRDRQESLRPEEARQELAKLSLAFEPKAFVRSAKNGDLTAVKLFLAAGMNPNARASFGYTALFEAVSEGHRPIIDALLKAKADVNVIVRVGSNYPEWTALSMAARPDKRDILSALLSAGATVKAINGAFVAAAANGYTDILHMLLDKGADHREAGPPALLDVATRDYKFSSATVKLLLDLGVDVNVRDDDDCTVLHNAANSGSLSVVQILLERGADIEARGNCWWRFPGSTPLLLATMKGREDIARTLLGSGADVNAKDANGRTALMHAAGNWSVILIRALLERRARVNEEDSHGNTALDSVYFAIDPNKAYDPKKVDEVIRLLKKHQAHRGKYRPQ